MEESQENRFIFGIRRSAILETTIAIAFLLISNYILGDGNRFFTMYPHPFWVIILLITVQYGTNEGLASAAIASIALLAFNIPEQRLIEDIYDYRLRISARPLMWLSAAVLLGQLTQRHLNSNNELSETLDETAEHVTTISNAYEELKSIKETLETRFAGQVSSTAAAYKGIKSIEAMSKSKVLMGVETVVKSVLNPHKFSVYALGPTGFESIISVGWKEDEHYARRFSTDSKLYNSLVSERSMLCAINVDDAKILDREGVLAAPFIDPSTQAIFGMIKIEELDFTDLTLSNVETFRVLCEWIGTAYNNAGRFQQAEENSLINLENELYSNKLFQHQKDLIKNLSRRQFITASIIEVRINNAYSFSKEERLDLAQSFGNIAKKTLPESCEYYSGKRSGMEFLILLPNVENKEAEAIVQIFMSNLQSSKKKNVKKAEFAFKVSDASTSIDKKAVKNKGK